jgi:putative colanic acid biosysnthesis UDP-glucose lipid carrier transferase
MNRKYQQNLQFLFSFLDLLSLNLIYILGLHLNPTIPQFNQPYIILYIICNVAWLLSSSATSVYSNWSMHKADIALKKTSKAYFLFLQIIILFTFFSSFSYSKPFALTIALGLGCALLVSRLFFFWGMKYLKIEDNFAKKVVILGYNDVGKRIAGYLTDNEKNIAIHGYFEDYNKVEELSVYPIIGSLKDCLDYSISNEVSEIYSTLLPKDNEYLYELAEIAENNFIRFKFVLDYNLVLNRNMHVDFVEDIPVFSLRREPLVELGHRVQKRLFDIVFSFLVIVCVLSWLVPLIALLIKIDSKGPVFFLQNRLGRDKRIFKVFKFRTMRTTESDQEYKQASKDDDRVTKVGKFLRRTSLDELPQFFNTLIGNMSIVGPRPHPLKMNDTYKMLISKYMIRHFLKPGITGWAQVNGYRGETKELKDVQGRIEHDIWYMENWNFWLDLKIIFLTVYNIIKGEKNAY